MKKTIIGVGIALMSFLMVVGFDKYEVKEVVEENGFMVLKDDIADISTIACKVTRFNKAYVFCTNPFDKTDKVVLSKNVDVKIKLKTNDIVLVTFDQDIVVKVKKNAYNIENKVIGQKVINK